MRVPARDVLSARGWGWPPHSRLDREILADVGDWAGNTETAATTHLQLISS